MTSAKSKTIFHKLQNSHAVQCGSQIQIRTQKLKKSIYHKNQIAHAKQIELFLHIKRQSNYCYVTIISPKFFLLNKITEFGRCSMWKSNTITKKKMQFSHEIIIYSQCKLDSSCI